MISTKIIASYQGKGNGRCALLEQIVSNHGKPYRFRVTIARRSNSWNEMCNLFLDALPPTKKAAYAEELKAKGKNYS